NRLRRSSPNERYSDGLVLQTGPVVLDESLDRDRIAAVGLTLGLLLTEAAVEQPSRDVVRVIMYLEFATDHFGDTRPGPQFRSKPERLGILTQPALHQVGPARGQLGRTARMGVGQQARFPMFSMLSDPPPDGAFVDAP